MTSKPPRPYFQVDTTSIKGEFFYSDFHNVEVEETDFSPQEWRQISAVFREPLIIITVIRVILTVVMILVTYLLLSHGSMSLLGVLAGLAGSLTALVSFRLAFPCPEDIYYSRGGDYQVLEDDSPEPKECEQHRMLIGVDFVFRHCFSVF